MMRVWHDGEAIVRDAIPPLPSRSLKAAISGTGAVSIVSQTEIVLG